MSTKVPSGKLGEKTPTTLTWKIPQAPVSDFGAEVRAGLMKDGQKELPSKYFYDELGSTLFDAITLLPEYGLTRAGSRLMESHAEEMVASLASPVIVAELGSGNGKKTRWILEALGRRQHTAYYPIEISPSALERCQQELGKIKRVSIVGFEREYLDGLLEVAARRRPEERLLVLFLGSTIGNFDRAAGEEFLHEVRGTLFPGDALLLATDLEKPIPQTLAAYDDALGVTAAFNLNLLVRINRELGADFDIGQFAHEARWNAEGRRIEMHVRSKISQTVNIPGVGIQVKFAAGETIWTESSHKYNLQEVVELARRTGFECTGQWVDHEWPFSQNLLIAV